MAITLNQCKIINSTSAPVTLVLSQPKPAITINPGAEYPYQGAPVVIETIQMNGVTYYSPQSCSFTDTAIAINDTSLGFYLTATAVSVVPLVQE